MENNENIGLLIESFKEYRKMLLPIQESLHNFSLTYDDLKNSVEKLDANLDGAMKEKLNEVHSVVTKQAKQTVDITSSIEKLVDTSERYSEQVGKLLKIMQGLENRITAVNNIEKEATEQFEKLETIIQEKRVNYNVKELQKSLESYKNNVERVSEFINKDIAKALTDNAKKIEEIKEENREILNRLNNENGNIEKLTETYSETNNLIRKLVEKTDVNEEYIYEILDKWALDRKIKKHK